MSLVAHRKPIVSAVIACKILINSDPDRELRDACLERNASAECWQGPAERCTQHDDEEPAGNDPRALDDAGGQAYLTEQAQSNPTAFMALLGKVLPPEPRGDAIPPVITFRMGDRDLRPPKDVTPAPDAEPFAMARLPAPGDE